MEINYIINTEVRMSNNRQRFGLRVLKPNRFEIEPFKILKLEPNHEIVKLNIYKKNQTIKPLNRGFVVRFWFST